MLGLSVTPTNVQTVLVEGRDADGATLEHDDFDTYTDPIADPVPSRASEQVAEAVLGLAEARDETLHAIGVTWSDGADLEASLLMEALGAAGLPNVVAVHQPRAAEALTHSIGRVLGYRRTAVCVVEPGLAMLSWVDSEHGDVQTVTSHAIDCDEQLVDWVAAVFDRHGWRPEGLFVVGSVGGFEGTARLLADRLAIPVIDPPEAELALAHGAALASAAGTPAAGAARTSALRGRALVAPLTMLAAGAVTFVVSVSLALGMHLVPEREAAPVREHRVTNTAGTPAAAEPRPAGPAPAAPVPAAPVINEIPAPEAPVDAPPEAPVGIAPEAPADILPEAPADIAPEAPVDEAPAALPPEPVVVVPDPVYVPPAPPAVVPPPAIVPPPAVVAPAVPQVPSYEKPRLRDRILDKIPGLNRLAN